jgi:hypothetical protein
MNGNNISSWETTAGTLSNQTAVLFKTNNASAKISTAGMAYVNLRLYNPAPTTNFLGRPSQIPLILLTGSSPPDVSGFVYKHVGIIADWSGWKLVSIPLSDFGNGNATDFAYGIYEARLAPNQWTQTTDRTFTPEELSKGYTNASNYTTWGDRDNYVDVDRVWLSAEAPAATFGDAGFSLEQTKDVPVTTREYTIALTNAVDASYAEAALNVAVLKNGEQSDGADYSVSIGGGNTQITVTMANNLDYDAYYEIILPDGLRDVFGNPYTGNKEFKFSSVAYETGDIVIDAETYSVSVSVSGNVPAGTILILAEKNDGRMQQAATAVYSGGDTISATLSDKPTSGSALRAFLWNGISGMVPYAPPQEASEN